jgi:hypothetical protein
MSVVNCTLSSGAATGGTNGVAGSGTFAGSSGNPGKAQGGNLAGLAGTLNLMNTILAASSSGGNGYGLITDNGHNLSSDLSLSLSGTSHANTDPKLGSLTSNGGPTRTMALLSGSPGINAIPSGSGLFPATDQRGVTRPQGSGADIGAYEAPNPTAVTILQPTLSSNRLNIVFPSQLNLSYVLQYKNQLTNAAWTALTTNAGTGGWVTNQVSTTNPPSRFYRVLVR